MNEIELVKLLGQSGVAVVTLVILGRMVWRVGERMIRAIDLMTQGFVDHTKADLGAWTDIGSRVDRQAVTMTERLDKHNASMAEEISELKDSFKEGFSQIQRDLAVIGTRIDTVLDWSERTPVGAEPRYLHDRMSERHTRHAEVPVVRPGTYRRDKDRDP